MEFAGVKGVFTGDSVKKNRNKHYIRIRIIMKTRFKMTAEQILEIWNATKMQQCRSLCR